jgi:AGZA family xanthine/uracil permease-like MFS transporter
VTAVVFAAEFQEFDSPDNFACMNQSWLLGRFELADAKTTVGREFRGAVATFLTMSNILFANPNILSVAGLAKNSTVACTALAAGICCLLMGWIANFPLATAPGMGLNAFVAYTLVKTAGSWQAAMGIIVLDGAIMLLLVLAGLREAVMNAIPRDLRLATGAGIGLFIALLGLFGAGFVRVDADAGILTNGLLTTADAKIALVGLIVTACLMVKKVPGAILIGIASATGMGLLLKVVHWPTAWSGPRFGNAFHADVRGALHWRLVPALFSVLMVDFFDTLGTATAIGEQAGLVDGDGRVKRIKQVLIVDSLAAAVGGTLGTSSVTAYIESAAGVAEGARTGLHSVFVGLMFFAAIFLAPLAGMVPSAATAPALILVGFLIMQQATRIDFTRFDTAIPAFVTLVAIPFTYSISHGIGYGFVLYVIIKLLTGKPFQVKPLMYVVAAAFAVFFWFER